jgi:hypothetical protein
MTDKEKAFVAGFMIGIVVVILCVLVIRVLDRNSVEARARFALAEMEMEFLTCKAVRSSRAAILAAEDGQLILYYEDSASLGIGRLYSVRPK